MNLSQQELDIIASWYEGMKDSNPDYLDEQDVEMYERIRGENRHTTY